MKNFVSKLIKNSDFPFFNILTIICRNYCSVEMFAIELTNYCLSCETLKNCDSEHVTNICKNKIGLELFDQNSAGIN